MHHVLVSASPLYLLGLEAVISRSAPRHSIVTFRALEDARHSVVNTPRGFLWCAAYPSPHLLLHDLIDPLAERYPDLRIMILQRQFSSQLVHDYFAHGISAMLCDLCTSEEIAEAIDTTLRGGKYIDRRIATSVSHAHLNFPGTTVSSVDELTEREKEVLRLIIDEHTTREIAAKLFISKCTVETHRLHLIRKLKVKNTAGLVREALMMAL